MDLRKLLLALMALPVLLLGALFLFPDLGGESYAGVETGEAPPEPAAEGEAKGEEGRDPSRKEEGPSRIEVEREAEPGAEDPSYLKALGGLTGRLVWKEGGKPVPDVEVVLAELWLDTIARSLDHLVGLTEGGDPVLFKDRDRTDEEGRFHLRGVHSRAILVLGIGLRTDKVTFRIVEGRPAPGKVLDLGDIALCARGGVKGRLVDEDGKGVAGARLRVADLPRMFLSFGLGSYDPEGLLFLNEPRHPMVMPFPAWWKELEKDLPFPEARSSEDGSFRVEGIRPGQGSLVVLPPEGLPLSRQIRVKAGVTKDLKTIRIKSGEILEGRALDGEDRPVQGAYVASGEVWAIGSRFALLKPPVETDEDGRFRILGAGPRKNWLVYRRAGDLPWKLHAQVRPGDRIEIRFPSLLSAEIHLRDPRNQPVDRAHLKLGAGDEAALFPGMERWLESAKHLEKDPKRPGVWKVEDLEEGRYRVLVKAPGYAVHSDLLTVKGGERDPLVLNLRPARRVRFEVTNTLGRPVGGARVYWSVERSRAKSGNRIRNPSGRLSQIPVLLGRTDRRGILETSAVEDGASQFLARHPAYGLAGSLAQVVAGQGRIRLILPEGGVVRGVVRGPREDWEDRSVVVAPRGDLNRHFSGVITPRFTKPGEDGTFEIENLTPGKWEVMLGPGLGRIGGFGDFTELFLLAGGFENPSRKVQVPHGGVVHVELMAGARGEVQGPGVIEGMVTLDGRPAQGLQVRIFTGRGRRTLTDEAGRFRIEGLEQAFHQVRVRRQDFQALTSDSLWQGRVDLRKNPVATLNLDFSRASLEIHLTDPQGDPAPGIGVRLFGRASLGGGAWGGGASFQGRTGEGGIARIEEIAAGEYRVELDWADRRSGLVLPKKEIQLLPGPNPPLRLQAVKALSLGGTARFDLTGLGPEERKLCAELVSKKKKNESLYLNVSNQGWSRLDLKKKPATYMVKGLAPGKHRSRLWRAGFQWTSQEFELRADRKNFELVFKPDEKWLAARLKARKKAGKK